ncbi:MAG: hypothetical protein DRG37_06900 [Deltaproteobacteria bacterium]|nr:MAG: hypothetical protein DRG37_06900 [Deltaproteobacteria bacterium]
MRGLYPYTHLDTITYTLLARIAELFIILGLAYNECGLMVKNLRHEISLGLFISVIFGSAVLGTNLLLGHLLGSNLLYHVLKRQDVNNPLLFFTVACCIAPFVEELFFRGLIYAWIRQRQSMLTSVLLSALIFASMHANISVMSIVQLTGGVIFALVYEWRHNIWPGYVIHCLANLGLWILPLMHTT